MEGGRHPALRLGIGGRAGAVDLPRTLIRQRVGQAVVHERRSCPLQMGRHAGVDARVPAAVDRPERLGAEQQGREDHQQEDRTDRLAGRGAVGIEPDRREPTDGGGEDEPRDDRDARVEPAHDEQGDRGERDRHQREDEEVEGPEEPQVDGGPVLPSGRLRGVGQPDPPGPSPQTGVSGRRGQQMVTQAGDHQTDHQRPPRVGDREAGYLEAAEHRRLERGGAEQQGQDVRKPHPARQDRLRRRGEGVVVAQGMLDRRTPWRLVLPVRPGSGPRGRHRRPTGSVARSRRRAAAGSPARSPG